MSLISSSSRARKLSLALLTFFAFALVACGADRPTPAYPASGDPALEDTDLYQYVAGDEADEEEDYGEDEEPFEAMPAEGGEAAAGTADAGTADPSTADPSTAPADPAPEPPTGG